MKKPSLRKGWNSDVVFSRLPRDGEKYGITEILKQEGEYLEDNEILETSFFPIVDVQGNITDQVLLKAGDETLDSSWENKEQFLIDPEIGTIKFPFGSRLNGKEISISYNFREIIGICTGLTWTVTTALDPAPAIGSKYPIGVTVGTTEITGSVDEYYVDRLLYEQASALSNDELVSFDIEIISSPKIKNPLIIKFTDAKFSSWSLDFTQDGITSQSCDFTAQNINIYKQDVRKTLIDKITK